MVPSLCAVEDVIPGLQILDRTYEACQAREVRDIIPKTRTDARVSRPHDPVNSSEEDATYIIWKRKVITGHTS